MSFLTPFLDWLLGWSLLLQPLIGIIVLSLLISVMVVLMYKFTTNQNLMKQLKDEMKTLQTQMKELRDHPDKALEVQKKVMDANLKYMMQSMRATLFTLLPILLIFGWLGANYGFESLQPNEQFSVELQFAEGVTGTVEAEIPDGVALTSARSLAIDNGKALFNYKGRDTGVHALSWTVDGRTYTKDVRITTDSKYEPPLEQFKEGPVKAIEVKLTKLKVLPWLEWGWLGTYILCSLVFSIALRKLLNVY